jgi:hypothetical protein
MRTRFRSIVLAALTALLVCLSGLSQTQIDLTTQTKRVDFTSAVSTKPVKTGTVLPPICVVGDLYFKSDAPAGANLYACVAANTWAAQGGSGGTDLPFQAGNDGSILSTDGANPQWSAFGGDVSGSTSVLTVTRLQGQPVSNSAPQTGQALVWSGNAWLPQTIGQGSGSLTLLNNGVTVGNRSMENLLSGFGLVNAITDTGSQLTVQQSVNTAVIETLSGEQSGSALLCLSSTGSATTYTCAMSPMLTTYTPGMTLRWIPDVSVSGGTVTLNIDTLGPKPVKLSDGTSDPLIGDVVAGNLYELWYDGSNLRLLRPQLAAGSTVARPACGAAVRGRLWQTFGAASVKDEFAVCAKDAAGNYAWRVVY